MNDRLRQNLAEARAELLSARRALRFWRMSVPNQRHGFAYEEHLFCAQSHFYKCLDRAWEAQCMVGGSL